MDALAAVGGAVAGGIRLGTVERIDGGGTPWVRLPRRKALRCRVLEGLSAGRLERARAGGAPVAVALLGRDEGLILGVVGAPGAEGAVDGRTVTLTGEEEVTLRCGRASITLTKAGKVLIRGDYVLSRSAGVNRVQGGSVQIN